MQSISKRLTTQPPKFWLAGPSQVFRVTMPRRFNVRMFFLLILTSSSIIIFCLWLLCIKVENASSDYSVGDKYSDNKLDGVKEISCDINGEQTIMCLKNRGEVYVPFTHIHQYFEINGKIIKDRDKDRFLWSHSGPYKIYHPKDKYDPTGSFMYFENYNVESRDRVKCISANGGVPISTQWDARGHFYPIQIAQFGLSHYSKNLTDSKPTRKLLENGEKIAAKWSVPPGGTVNRVYDEGVRNHVLMFDSGEARSIDLKLQHKKDFVLSVDVFLERNSSFSVALLNKATNTLYQLHYVIGDGDIWTQNNNIYHGLGAQPEWKRLTRELNVDLDKGIIAQNRNKTEDKISKSNLTVVSVTLKGSGGLDNLTLATSEHMLHFYDSADWFLRNQDPNTGGWPIAVKRKVAEGFDELQSGWYSAMGQGHAFSVLTRAYYHSGGDIRYLRAAVAGLRPFKVPSSSGGVLTNFMGRYQWYEEYPTEPSMFVLNGFIYSLIGLYDLKTIAPPGQVPEAEMLFKTGMESLKNMLMLFDMGTRTAYDLRHVTLKIEPNIARWSYHAAHITQLLLLATIEDDPLFNETARRWIGYMNGKRAAHN